EADIRPSTKDYRLDGRSGGPQTARRCPGSPRSDHGRSSQRRCRRGFQAAAARNQPRAKRQALKGLEAGSQDLGLPGYHLIEVGDVIRRSIGPIRLQFLVLPLHQAVRLGYMELFLIAAAGVAGIAAVAIADHQGFQVVRQAAAQRLGVRSPDLVEDMPQALGHKRVAVSMDLVSGVTDLDAGAGKPALSEAGHKRQVELSQRGAVKDLEGVRIVPIELGYPEVNVLIVVQLNVPGESLAGFCPKEA